MMKKEEPLPCSSSSSIQAQSDRHNQTLIAGRDAALGSSSEEESDEEVRVYLKMVNFGLTEWQNGGDRHKFVIIRITNDNVRMNSFRFFSILLSRQIQTTYIENELRIWTSLIEVC